MHIGLCAHSSRLTKQENLKQTPIEIKNEIQETKGKEVMSDSTSHDKFIDSHHVREVDKSG